MASDLSGTELGNYRLESLIGKGGMGEVWLARHPLLGREVAVKVLAPALSDDDEALARFRREALTVNQIDHSSVVEVTDFGALPDGRAYCVMELLRGQSLESYLAEEGQLSLHDAVTLLVPVIEGLAAAHRAGVVHRDIMPDNVFLDTGKGGQRVVRILDFGIAKLLDPGDDDERMTKTGQLLGTPLYMSPEQVSGDIQRVGPWSDVYSLGVLLYRMLAGKPPFAGGSFGRVLMHHMATPPPSIRAVRPDLPEAVDKLLLHTLSKLPDDRVASMAELSEALMQASEFSGAAPTLRVASADALLEVSAGPKAPVSLDAEEAALAPTVTPAHITPLKQPLDAAEATSVKDPEPPEPPEPAASLESSLSLAASEKAGRAAEATLPVKRRSRLPGRMLGGVVAALLLVGGGVAALLLRTPADTAIPAATPPPARRVVARRVSVVPPDMVGVPAGCFEMGAIEKDPDEHPVHRVCLASYALERTHVTVQAYAKCVNAGVCPAPLGHEPANDPGVKGAWKAQCNWRAPGRGLHPVNCLKWQAARTYCRWRKRRLPTEAEWEYAARGSEGRTYPWGEEPATCKLTIMADARGPGCGAKGTWAVGSKPGGKGPFGALDQAGNVWDWTEDCYAKRFYDRCKGGCSNPLNHCEGDPKRVIRGGSYLTGGKSKLDLRATVRGIVRSGARMQGVGFRCVQSLPHGAVAGDAQAGAGLLRITRVKASSHVYPFGQHTYVAANVTDGRLDTSWQPLGSKKDSKGQFIRLWLAPSGSGKSVAKVLVTAVSVANGFQAFWRSSDQFFANSRLRRITLRFSDGSYQRAFLPPDRKGFVRLRLTPTRTKWLVLEVDSIYPGATFRDVAVSELKVWGKP